MPTNADINQRLSALIAKIEIEQNPRKFTTLVEELNRLLDSDQSDKHPPAPSRIGDSTPDSGAVNTSNSPLGRWRARGQDPVPTRAANNPE